MDQWHVRMPEIGEGLGTLRVVRMLAKPGELLREGDTFMEVQGDKYAVEIPCSYNCLVETVETKVGNTVRVGEIVMTVEIESASDALDRDPIANIRTGVKWVCDRDVELLCKGGEESRYSFEEFREFLNNCMLLCSNIKRLDLARLPRFTHDLLRSSLFEASLLIAPMEKVRWNEGKTQDAEYERACSELRIRWREAVRKLYGALDLARGWLDAGSSVSRAQIGGLRSRVFLVQGTEGQVADEVVAFVRQLGLDPVIIEYEPSLRHSLIDKLERFSDVDYCVTILTADDIGGPSNDRKISRLRARQHVVLELGFFLGVLGRKRVAVIYDERIELPSSAAGLVYIRLDEAHKWKIALANEMGSAGIAIKKGSLAISQTGVLRK